MSVMAKLRCSECETVREVDLREQSKELDCPVCGRRIANLPEEDLAQMEQTQKSQCILSGVTLALFVIAIVCLCFWACDLPWISGEVANAKGALEPAKAPVEPQVAPMIGAIICGIAALVTGILSSMKRFVVEF